jgi:hypothetical protein
MSPIKCSQELETNPAELKQQSQKQCFRNQCQESIYCNGFFHVCFECQTKIQRQVLDVPSKEHKIPEQIISVKAADPQDKSQFSKIHHLNYSFHGHILQQIAVNKQ